MSNPRMRIEGAVQRYYDHLAAEARNRNRGQATGRVTAPGSGTITTYNQIISALVTYCADNGITHVHMLTKRDIDTVLNNRLDAIVPRRGDEPSKNTINNHTGALRAVIKWWGAPGQNWLTADKVAVLTSSLKEVEASDDDPALIVPEDKWPILFEWAGAEHIADRVYLELGYYLALRDSEIRRLRWEHIDLKNKRLRAFRDKRADSLLFTIPQELLDTLSEWIAWLEKHNGQVQGDWFLVPARTTLFGRKLFQGWPVSPTKQLGRITGGRIIQKHLKRMGYTDDEIFGQASHVMRRSRASHLFIRGYDINLIRRMLGHKTIEMTMHYIRRATDVDKVMEMIAAPVKKASTAIVPSQTGHRAADIPPADASRILAALMADLDEAESVAFAQRLSRLQLAA